MLKGNKVLRQIWSFITALWNTFVVTEIQLKDDLLVAVLKFSQNKFFLSFWCNSPTSQQCNLIGKINSYFWLLTSKFSILHLDLSVFFQLVQSEYISMLLICFSTMFSSNNCFRLQFLTEFFHFKTFLGKPWYVTTFLNKIPRGVKIKIIQTTL